MFIGESVDKHKKSCMPEIIFQKNYSKYESKFEYLYFGQNFAFLGTVLGRFNQPFKKFFLIFGQPWWPTFLLTPPPPPPDHRKASYGPELIRFLLLYSFFI